MEPLADKFINDIITAIARNGIGNFDGSITDSGSLLSIAISLKRIADTLADLQPVSIQMSLDRIAGEIAGVPYDHAPGADNAQHRMGLTDGIMHAIEQGLLAASQRG